MQLYIVTLRIFRQFQHQRQRCAVAITDPGEVELKIWCLPGTAVPVRFENQQRTLQQSRHSRKVDYAGDLVAMIILLDNL